MDFDIGEPLSDFYIYKRYEAPKIQSTNLLLNPSFEDWEDNEELPNNWRCTGSAYNSTCTKSNNALEGNFAINVSSIPGTEINKWAGVYQYLDLKPNTYYRLRGLVNTKDLD